MYVSVSMGMRDAVASGVRERVADGVSNGVGVGVRTGLGVRVGSSDPVAVGVSSLAGVMRSETEAVSLSVSVVLPESSVEFVGDMVWFLLLVWFCVSVSFCVRDSVSVGVLEKVVVRSSVTVIELVTGSCEFDPVFVTENMSVYDMVNVRSVRVGVSDAVFGFVSVNVLVNAVCDGVSVADKVSVTVAVTVGALVGVGGGVMVDVIVLDTSTLRDADRDGVTVKLPSLVGVPDSDGVCVAVGVAVCSGETVEDFDDVLIECDTLTC